MNTPTIRLALILAAAALLAAGCNGSSDNAGTLNLSVSDTPVDGAEHVTVAFTGVEIQPADNMGSDRLEFDFHAPKVVDLLDQQAGRSAVLLDGVSLPAGSYAWIRLKVDESQSSITLSDGSVHPLTIPSGSQTGLKLVRGFGVAAGSVTDFTVDFDLRKSVVLDANGYKLKPALRIIDTLAVGSIAGSADNTLVLGGLAISALACMPAAYIYAGGGVTPVDINTSGQMQPVATATLALNTTTGKYDYSADFLAAGTYTVALTCAGLDDPALTDALQFSAAKDATVTAGSTATVDFP
ncbi:MAG TPA: DUF4382 domain-containing protein [Gammaproteobacteria bacterium]|jgi:hypothetical protein|nr:DUF4382 domain-containing protein [Gammaproteobacteria bacterium]